MISFESSACCSSQNFWDKTSDAIARPLLIVCGKRYQIEELHFSDETTIRGHLFKKKSYKTATKVVAILSLPILFPFCFLGYHRLKQSTHHKKHLSMFRSVSSPPRSAQIIKVIRSPVRIKPNLKPQEKAKEAFQKADHIYRKNLNSEKKQLYSKAKRFIWQKKGGANNSNKQTAQFDHYFTELFSYGTCFGMVTHILELLIQKKNAIVSLAWIKKNISLDRVYYLQYLENLRGDLFEEFSHLPDVALLKPLLYDNLWNQTEFQKNLIKVLESIPIPLKETLAPVELREKVSAIPKLLENSPSFITIEFMIESKKELCSLHIMGGYTSLSAQEYVWIDSEVYCTYCKEDFLDSLSKHLLNKYGERRPILKFSLYKIRSSMVTS